MNVETSRFARTVFSVVLGYIGTVAVNWFILDSSPIVGRTKLVAFGVIFVITTVAFFILITHVESELLQRGYSLTTGSRVVYFVATIGLLFGVGANISYWVLNQFSVQHKLVLPLTTVGGIFVAFVIGYLLYQDRVKAAISA